MIVIKKQEGFCYNLMTMVLQTIKQSLRNF